MDARPNLFEYNILFDFLSEKFVDYFLSAPDYNFQWPFYIMKSCLALYDRAAPFGEVIDVLYDGLEKISIFPPALLTDSINANRFSVPARPRISPDGELIEDIFQQIYDKILDKYPDLMKITFRPDEVERKTNMEQMGRGIQRLHDYCERVGCVYQIGDIPLPDIIERARHLPIMWNCFSADDLNYVEQTTL